MAIEQLIAYHCGPALTGIKPANLFSCPNQMRYKIISKIIQLNKKCNIHGVYFMIIRRSNKSILLFVYNRELLSQVLTDFRAQEILYQAGYDLTAPLETLLTHLADRLTHSDVFPHEIGIFLGYPIDDVQGFIFNRGTNYKICGYWKVYGDEQSAAELFQRYTQCRISCFNRMIRGESLEKLCATAI